MISTTLALPLEKIDNRPEIQVGNSFFLNKIISKELLFLIFSNLDSQSLASCDLTCKNWHHLTDHQSVNDILWNYVIAAEIAQYTIFFFGKTEWNEYFGDVGDIPNFPRDICKILTNPCLFFENQTVGQTHMCVLVPKTVNGKLLTLSCLVELVQTPKKGKQTGFNKNESCHESILKRYAHIAVQDSHWMMLTNKAISISRDAYTDEETQYFVATPFDIVLSVFIKYVVFGEYEKAWDSLTYFGFQEGFELAVRDFGPSGISLCVLVSKGTAFNTLLRRDFSYSEC